MNVHTTWGKGFEEAVYQRCLVIEFELLNISFGRETSMRVLYKGIKVGEGRVDFLVEQKYA